MTSQPLPPLPLPPPPRRFKHHVLFSYASKEAEYVKAVHAVLPVDLKAFDYARDDNVIWGKDLAKELEHLYTNAAPFCVVFISEAYLADWSHWTNQEFAIVLRVEKRKPGYMLPVMIDGEVPEQIENIAWVKKPLLPEKLAALIVAKIREPPPEPFWFYWSMEVRVAIAVVLILLTIFARSIIDYFLPSRTSLKSANANAEVIIAHFKNDGPKSSTMAGQRLKFGALPIEDTELRLENPASATIAPGEHDVKLIVRELLPKCGTDLMRPNHDKVEAILDRQPVTLEIDIRESDDAPGHSKRQFVTLPAARFKLFVRKWVSGRDTPCF